jgi:hypothetical protein
MSIGQEAEQTGVETSTTGGGIFDLGNKRRRSNHD